MVAPSVGHCVSILAFLQAHTAVGLVRFDAERATVSLEDKFLRFTQKYGRTYEKGTDEYDRRFGLFAESAERVEQLNARPGKTWTAGVNKLADYTHDERQQLLGWRGGATRRGSQIGVHSPVSLSRDWRDAELPKAHDWNHLSNMKDIRDQGACGSCWAITTSTVLAAHSEIYGDNRTFSTQELVECVPNPRKCGGKGGCEGATVELAMQYVVTRGVAQDWQSPYAGLNLFGCEFPLEEKEVNMISSSSAEEAWMHKAGPKGRDFGMVGWQKLPENKYHALVNALVERGPVAVSVAANQNFMMYQEGVFHSQDCDWVLNHAVTLVGFGKDASSNLGFWQIQNSWGGDWGEAGRMRLLRHADEEAQCGEDTQPDMGVGCEGGPTTVTVCGTCGILYDSVVPIFKGKA